MNKRALIVDVARCTGCNNCVLATKDEHVGNDFPGYAAAQPAHGHEWISIERHTRGSGSMVDVSYVPRMCNHCDNAPCIKAAGDGSIYKRPDGVVIIDPVKARGRKDLVAACPYGAIAWNEEAQVPQAWIFDAHLLDNGWTEAALRPGLSRRARSNPSSTRTTRCRSARPRRASRSCGPSSGPGRESSIATCSASRIASWAATSAARPRRAARRTSPAFASSCPSRGRRRSAACSPIISAISRSMGFRRRREVHAGPRSPAVRADAPRGSAAHEREPRPDLAIGSATPGVVPCMS